MRSGFVIFLTTFLLIYGGGSLYAGVRLWECFSGELGSFTLLFWLMYVVLAVLPITSRMRGAVRRGGRPLWLIKLGDYWLATVYYLVVAWLALDLARLLIPGARLTLAPSPALGLGVITLLLVALAHGTVQGTRTRIKRYEISIDKRAAGLRSLRAVVVSDIHLGPVMNAARLKEMVAEVNPLNPDIIFLVGDIIDGDVSYFADQGMARVLRELSARYGVFAVLGNHEYLGGSGDSAASHLNEAGIHVLRDAYVKINEQFYIVGREDRMASRFTGQNRLPLTELVKGIDQNRPIILMDHQPYDLHEASTVGVDLQFSGHTHNGQFFPNNLITSRIFEVGWGYLRKGDFQIIVSCGYGTWGPPIRIGSHSEIVQVEIVFKE
jgi:predicted MPP superfamily phosphohydrolase